MLLSQSTNSEKWLQNKLQKGYLPNLSAGPLVIQAMPVAIAHPPRRAAGFHATDQSLGETGGGCMDVSKNRVIPKWMVYSGKPY